MRATKHEPEEKNPDLLTSSEIDFVPSSWEAQAVTHREISMAPMMLSDDVQGRLRGVTMKAVTHASRD